MSASPIFFFLLSSLLSPPSICYGGDPRAPDYFRVSFGTTVVNDATTSAAAEPIVMEVNRSWAPIGADRFYALIADHYYDDAAFFRVVPDFVVQWGIAALPEHMEQLANLTELNCSNCRNLVAVPESTIVSFLALSHALSLNRP